MTADTDEEITAAVIARLAGVGRAAVSNWRRRYPEFPRPVGGSLTSPTFSRAAVEAWLTATGKADQLATAGQTETGTQRLDHPPRSSGLNISPTSPQPPEPGVADLTAGQLLARVMASMLPRSIGSTRHADLDDAIGLDEADDPDAEVVLDPACGDGTLLQAVSDRFGSRVRLAGQEIREDAAALAALALRGSSNGSTYEIYAGNSLLDDHLSKYLGAAAAVVCEPPLDLPQWPAAQLTTDPRWSFGIPAPRDSELAWVQHCYSHLRPRGVAVVAVSPRTCVQQSGEHIRAALVRTGVLRDVIALPTGIGSLPGTDVYLWVLQRPYGAPDYAAVRMIDLSGLGDAADVPHEFGAWARLFTDADPTISRAVPRLELLDGDVNLLPARHVAARTQASPDDFARVTGRLRALYADAARALPRFGPPDEPPRRSYVTFGELERVGALTIHARDATPLAGDLLMRTLSRPPAVATGTAADDTGVAQVIEIDPVRLDVHFVAAFLRFEASAQPVANTLGALSRDDLRRCRIPRMSLADQHRYGDTFRYLDDLDNTLRALARTSASVIEQTRHGLTTGVLEPRDPAPDETDRTHTSEGETRQP